MTITADREKIYPALPENVRDAIDDAYRVCVASLHESLPTATLANDDTAENLVGAIARYLVDSGPDDWNSAP